MSRLTRQKIANIGGQDDPMNTLSVKDLSGGQNTRQDSQNIGANQAVTLTNVDIGTPGQRKKRPGLTLLEDLSKDSQVLISPFEPDGATNELQTVIVSGADTAVFQWPSSGSFSKITGTDNIVDTDIPIAFKVFKSGGDGDVMVYGSSTKNWKEIQQDNTVADLGNTSGTGTDSPPRSNVGTFFNGRFWVLVNNILDFSDAFSNDYSGAFDTQAAGNRFNMPVGTERFLIGIRNKGLICGGNDEIRYIVPSNTPAATDETGILVKDGCVANRSAVLAGDDILYLAKDGVRGVFKTQFDTLQYKTSLPVSYPLKDQFDVINWAQVHKASATYYDNKYFLALPTSSSTYNNTVWVYYPATNGWMVIDGWNVADWAVMQVQGEDKLYAIDATDGKVYQAWSGTTDNGASFTYTETIGKNSLGSEFEEKMGGEVMVRLKATDQLTVSVFASFDESDFNKLGDIVTEDRTTNFAAWTLPLIFQDAGIYTKKFHIDTYGEWYQIQVKIEHSGEGGDDLTVLQSAVLARLNRYLSEELQ